MQTHGHNDSGFTLIELMVVTLIIGILVSIAIATYVVSTQRASAVTCEHNRRFLERVAASVFRAEDTTSTTATVEALQPYTINWESVRACPTDSTQMLYFDSDGVSVLCPVHGR